MDTVSNIENNQSGSGKSKTVVIVIVSVLVGALLGAGTMIYFGKDLALLGTTPSVDTSTLSYPEQKVPQLDPNAKILLPKNLVSEQYYVLINKIAAELTQLGVSNNTVLIPLLNTIRQKSAAQDFTGFFDVVVQAKNEIKREGDVLTTVRADIAALRKETEATVRDTDIRTQTLTFLASGDVFVQSFSDYHTILNETLSGSIPTQTLLNKLNAQVALLLTNSTTFKENLTTLLTTVKQKYDSKSAR